MFENINLQLYKKLEAEYQSFIDELWQMPFDELMKSAYEKVFKEDILLIFEHNDWPIEQAKAMLALENPLDDLYRAWQESDSSYVDMLRECIDNRAESIATAMEEKNGEHNDHLPDPSIDVSERNLFGYSYDGMLPLQQERAIELFNQKHSVFLLYEDDTESLADNLADIEGHDGLFGIEAEDWHTLQAAKQMENDAKEIEATKEALLLHGEEAVYGIYQLKSGVETRNYRFETLESLESRGLSVDKNNYNLVYAAPLSEGDTLDALYAKFNIAHPADFRGHSLSISDVIVLRQGHETNAHYVDVPHFVELPSFFKDAVEKTVAVPHAENGSDRKPSIVAQLQTARSNNGNEPNKPKGTTKGRTDMEV